MAIKIVVSLLLLFMIYNLFKAMFVMLKAEPGKPSMSRYIGRRVLLSAVIVLLLLFAVAMGWITPNPHPH